jgi:riboflavin kinase/FMN adenylyltransferase
MKIYEGLQHTFQIPHPVLTAGTFDGVHVGHRRIIDRVNEAARQSGGESVLLTFEPHPRLVLFPEDNNLKLLTTREEKIELLEKAGVQNLVILPFTREFSRLTSQEYVRDILAGALHISRLVIGYDHQFGRNREGSIGQLREFAPQFGFEVEEIPAQDVDQVRVSSTKIRHALSDGDIHTANTFLTYPYLLSGNVVHGDKRGRTIGFPTANISVPDPLKLIPADGVYAVYAEVDNKKYEAMLNIGVRPTVDGLHHKIEAHLLDWDGDLYGKDIRVWFKFRIRDEKKFDGIESLKTQLHKDAQEAKQLLGDPA